LARKSYVEVYVNRAEKAQVIADLKDKVNKSNMTVVTDFRGMKVEQMERLRNELQKKEVEYQVVKNTLAGLAFKDTDHAIIHDKFQDCCAVAFIYDDPVASTKTIVDFTKKEKRLQLKFASFEGRYLDAKDLEELSKLPGREELLSKMLATMNAVPTNFVCLFANMLRNLLYALNALKEKKEKL
jgi:large subunit ribosomal protein L10